MPPFRMKRKMAKDLAAQVKTRAGRKSAKSSMTKAASRLAALHMGPDKDK